MPSVESFQALCPFESMTIAATLRSSTSTVSVSGRLRVRRTDLIQGLASRRFSTPLSSNPKSVEPAGMAASSLTWALLTCTVGMTTMRLIWKRGDHTHTT